MTPFVLYCLSIWFWFYLLNYSDIVSPAREWLYPKLWAPVSYMLGCSFCSCFHVTWIAYLFGQVPFSYMFAAPVVNLFLLKIFQYLYVPKS